MAIELSAASPCQPSSAPCKQRNAPDICVRCVFSYQTASRRMPPPRRRQGEGIVSSRALRGSGAVAPSPFQEAPPCRFPRNHEKVMGQTTMATSTTRK